MVPTILNPFARAAGSALLAVLLLCFSAAILRADEGRLDSTLERSSKHCRIYFGCLPDLAKERGRFN
jgi:hypothetical protein